MTVEWKIIQVLRKTHEEIDICTVPTEEMAHEFIKRHSERGRILRTAPIYKVTSLDLTPVDEATLFFMY